MFGDPDLRRRVPDCGALRRLQSKESGSPTGSRSIRRTTRTRPRRPGSSREPRTKHTLWGSGGQADTHDIAVILLDSSPGIAPAQLPTAGLLDQLTASNQLRDQTFTTVGYGAVRTDKTGGPHAIEGRDGVRRYALQSFQALRPNSLELSQNPSTGDGGICAGDSGGPHFLGGVEATSWSRPRCAPTAGVAQPTRRTGWTLRPPETSWHRSSPCPDRSRSRTADPREGRGRAPRPAPESPRFACSSGGPGTNQGRASPSSSSSRRPAQPIAT